MQNMPAIFLPWGKKESNLPKKTDCSRMRERKAQNITRIDIS
jgi:hypothetical protein